MLLAGMRCTRPQSVTAYSANPPGADAMTRSPDLRSATSLPTASTSPAHSRPSREPVPNSLPCGWPEATMRSARLRLDACTRIKTSFGAGAGRGTSRTATPLSPTTAAFTTLPGWRELNPCQSLPAAKPSAASRLRTAISNAHWSDCVRNKATQPSMGLNALHEGTWRETSVSALLRLLEYLHSEPNTALSKRA
jgi:hypothetical protein